MKYDNISFINWNDWNKLRAFIMNNRKIYINFFTHIGLLRSEAKRIVLTLKWSAKNH